MTTTDRRTATTPTPARLAPDDPAREVTWRRLRTPAAGLALLALAVGVLGQALGTLVAGRLATDASAALVGLLALLVVGGATLVTTGQVIWAAVSDRAEGALRGDLLSAALHQPLSALSEQAVGEILDRVDDDTHEVGTLTRQQLWGVLRAGFGVVPMWVVASLTWWPAWFVFPLAAALIWPAVRRLLPTIAERKVVEEMAWTDHSAALEESIAGRDDLRTSLGQPFAVRRVARLSAMVHERFWSVLRLERALILRAGLVLHAALAGIAVAGVAMVAGGGLSVARLVTLFLVTSMFVGQINNVAQHLPDLQAGLGALIRLRQMLSSPPEPVGGAPVPDGDLDLRFADLEFAYEEGGFALRDVDLRVPAGQTMALVGRTGSGKSTLASLVSRAVDPAPGTVLLGGVDVLDIDLHDLRAAVGVVTQLTDILAGTLEQNITLFAPIDRAHVQAAVDELGLTDWVAHLPAGLDTVLGPSGTSLSAGEEQLVAFARLLVRDVRVVILDEATARMDPVTEARVVAASDRLLAHRTGVLVAHRLSTTRRAEQVAVLERGRVVQSGPMTTLRAAPGAFRALWEASATQDEAAETTGAAPVGGVRRTGAAPPPPQVGSGPSLARGVWHALRVQPQWGLLAVGLFTVSALLGSVGALTGFVWGHVVVGLRDGATQPWLVALLVAVLLLGPVLLAVAIGLYPRWWVEVLLRTRMSVLRGQTAQHRLPAAPAGEVVARAMDADRYARYADRWVDFVNGLVIAVVTAFAAGTYVAGLVLLVVMAAAASASVLGRPIAGRTAARSSAARARFGRTLVSSLESARTVKLAGRTPQVHAHLQQVDGGRIDAAVKEHRVQAVLDGVPIVMVQVGVVAAWAALVEGVWGLATALMVVNAVNGFDWFGRVAGAVVTEAPGTRAWQEATCAYAGGGDLMDLPDDVDLVSGAAPMPAVRPVEPLDVLALHDLSVVHDDGTVGVSGVDLTVRRGELVLLLGRVGSGKSSLLRALAGLVHHTGSLTWNGERVEDPQTFLRPTRVAYVAQVPRVFSGTFVDNVRLGYADRPFDRPVADARLAPDVEAAGGPDAVVGHRGLRLSGGQVQRVALARALAAETEVVLADDVSSALDAATELELWRSLRERSATVVGATSKRAALAQADRVVVLSRGRVEAVGPWTELEARFGALAG
ncbi:ABC transporter ATP-binding protein [Luteipulveratus flavus]|uniref:ABC transporter ATP-binding protein n=1 Tax=Luteipulveratus flavus TaxID=3031728 RepID=A0ABT6C845_9MICO|nr:ABC transporter ATP-binding protein [Luteipulveratus sp. YIM 133296]MDF8264462.1 ABC transporter ATP-binding protein [Luteipulveratus sp. YIM 133296]